MEKPDQGLFEEDLRSAEFLIGATKGLWGLPAPDVLAEQPPWPKRILWIAAVPRENAPDRFYILLDVSGYRSVPPTGTFWDPSTRGMLIFQNVRKAGKAAALRWSLGRTGRGRLKGRAARLSTIHTTGWPLTTTRAGQGNSHISCGPVITPLSITWKSSMAY